MTRSNAPFPNNLQPTTAFRKPRKPSKPSKPATTIPPLPHPKKTPQQPSTTMPSGASINRIRKKLTAAAKSTAPVAMDAVGRCGPLPPSKRRVMVVADSSRESSIALQWALSHAILEQDDLILLHVETPNASRRGGALSSFLRRPTSLGTAGNQQHHHQQALSSISLSSTSSSSSTGSAMSPCSGSGEGGEYEFLEVMRVACGSAQPKVRVQMERVEMEGRDKAAAILSQTKILGVDLLVIGQRRPATSFLGCKLSGSMSGRGLDTAEFLIEHCKCLCVGVQKKGQNAGYLLNTKTHKNFWLLA